MKFPSSKPLTDAQLDVLDESLLKSGSDDAILGISALDGFLTAVISGPTMIPPSQWVPVLWGGESHEPEWESEAELQQFMQLVMQHLNSLVSVLMDFPQDFEPLFLTNSNGDSPVVIAEEWCFGYMRGVELGHWPELHDEMKNCLSAIALHGDEKCYEVLDTLSLEEHQNSVAAIGPAARKLHAYWLAQRTPAKPVGQATKKSGPKVGRNDPCPCGSGKKFKQCCLH